MAASISTSDVLNGFATTVSEDEVQVLIIVVDEADACLDANGVAEDKQRMLKIYAVRHMLAMQANGGRGNVTSQSAPSGASQSYNAWKGMGLDATPYGNLVKQLDRYGCLTNVLQNDGPRLAIMSVGARCE